MMARHNLRNVEHIRNQGLAYGLTWPQQNRVCTCLLLLTSVCKAGRMTSCLGMKTCSTLLLEPVFTSMGSPFVVVMVTRQNKQIVAQKGNTSPSFKNSGNMLKEKTDKFVELPCVPHYNIVLHIVYTFVDIRPHQHNKHDARCSHGHNDQFPPSTVRQCNYLQSSNILHNSIDPLGKQSPPEKLNQQLSQQAQDKHLFVAFYIIKHIIY